MLKLMLLITLVVIAAVAIVVCVVITRDGELVTPRGKGIVTLDVGEFEAFPLPDYAAKHVTDRYKSYFVEVEPGIKVHALEVKGIWDAPEFVKFSPTPMYPGARPYC